MYCLLLCGRLILTRCDTLGIVLLAFWVPRELNRVSDYLSHLSVLIRSDVTGVFTGDSAKALATAAAGVLDDSVFSVLARATGVDADSVEQVMQRSAGSRRRPEEFNSQDLHCSSISQRLRSRKSSPIPPDREVHKRGQRCPYCFSLFLWVSAGAALSRYTDANANLFSTFPMLRI